MADQTRTMVVEITADDKTKKGTKSASSNFAAVAKQAALAGAAIGAAALVQSANLWIRQEQAVKQLEIRLKSTRGAAGLTSKELQGMAASLQKVSVYGDEAIMEMQALLLTFTQVKGETFKGAQQAILDVATAMGTDLKSAAIQVGKALNDPVLGLSALSRSGIQFSDVQKETIKDMVAMGRTAEAQAIILKELETQFGGASQATGLGGAVKQFNNALGDLFERLGKGATSGVSGRLEDLTNQMSSEQTMQAFEDIGSAVGSLASGFLNLGKTIGEMAGALVTLSTASEDWSNKYGETVGPIIAQQEAAPATFGEALQAETGRLNLGGIGGAVTMGPMGATGGRASTLSLGGIGGGGIGGDISGTNGPLDMAAFRGASADITGLEEALMSEEETILASYDRRKAIIQEGADQGVITQSEAAKYELDIFKDKEKRLTKLQNNENRKRKENAIVALQGVGAFADNIFGAMANSAEAGSRKEFEANKKRATVSAIVNTAQGATKAFSQWGWPWGAIAAAAVIAAGATQINKIQSQNFDGGGGGVSETFAPVTPEIDTGIAPVTQPQPVGRGAEQQGVTYNITVLGNIIDNDQFARDLITPLERARLDGVEAQI